jgi:hypothetical protein
MSTKIYVGHGHDDFKGIFRSDVTPTEDTHGSQYRYVVGPFRTLRAAEFMAQYGYNNPHLQCVEDAERIVKQEDIKARLRPHYVNSL